MVLMDQLAGDHRTASIAGDRMSRRQLAKRADVLLTELEEGEVTERVLSSAGVRPALVVITEHRLIAVPLAGDALRSITRPYRLRFGDGGLLGRAAEAVDAAGNRLKVRVTPDDLTHLRHATTVASGSTAPPSSRTAAPHSPAESAPARPGPGWRWERPVLSWQDAEHLAAAHLNSLGFTGALVTTPGPDDGLDVVAQNLAAQVKFHANPTGAPDIQRLRGAADVFSHRVFYATAYTPAAHATADRLGIALFQYTGAGAVVAVNDAARHLDGAGSGTPQQPERTRFGTLTFDARQNRAVGWAQQLEQAARTKPVSDRKRKGARQLAERQRALELLVRGLAELEDSDNPLYKRGRKERTLTQAEKTLKEAARILRVPLR